IPNQLLSDAGAFPGNPYARFSWLSERQRNELLLEYLRHASQTAIWNVNSDDAWLSLSHQPWDSERLSRSVGKVDAFFSTATPVEETRALAESLVGAVNESDCSFVTARVVEKDSQALAVLDCAGFRRAAGLINLALFRASGDASQSDNVIVIRTATHDDET